MGNGETVETVSDFIFGGSKITTDGDCSPDIKRRLLLGRKIMTNLDSIFKSCSHEIKRCLLLGRKVMTNLDSIFKSRDITLPTKVRLVKAMVFQCSCMDVRVGL